MAWNQAWRALTPFRTKVAFDVAAPWLTGRVTSEGFFYPHGHALVVTATIEPPKALPLDDAVALSHRVRHDPGLVADPGNSPNAVSLDSYAVAAIRGLRETALGTGAAPGTVSPQPFSVVTFIKLEGVNALAPVKEGGPIHLALDGLTSWNSAYKSLTPAPLAIANVPSKLNGPSGVSYAGKRGRVSWLPSLAASSTDQFPSCYHHARCSFSSCRRRVCQRIVAFNKPTPPKSGAISTSWLRRSPGGYSADCAGA